jgi:hypothetical protein
MKNLTQALAGLVLIVVVVFQLLCWALLPFALLVLVYAVITS